MMIKLSELVKYKCPVCGSYKISTEVSQKDDNRYLINDDIFFPSREDIKIETVCIDCGHHKTKNVPFNFVENMFSVGMFSYTYEFNKNRDTSNDENTIIIEFGNNIQKYMEMQEYDGTTEYMLKALKYAVDKSNNKIEFDLEVE